jgi:hypothetical protein
MELPVNTFKRAIRWQSEDRHLVELLGNWQHPDVWKVMEDAARFK